MKGSASPLSPSPAASGKQEQILFLKYLRIFEICAKMIDKIRSAML